MLGVVPTVPKQSSIRLAADRRSAVMGGNVGGHEVDEEVDAILTLQSVGVELDDTLKHVPRNIYRP